MSVSQVRSAKLRICYQITNRSQHTYLETATDRQARIIQMFQYFSSHSNVLPLLKQNFEEHFADTTPPPMAGAIQSL